MRASKYLSTNRRLSPLDKIRAHYIEGKKLSEKLEYKRVQFESANSLRVQGYSKEQVVQILIETHQANSRATAYTIIRDAEDLFGDITKSNKDGLRHILTENFLAIYRKARKENDLKECNRALENVAKINGLYQEETTPIDWSKIIVPVPLFVSDPNVLKAQQTEDATFTIS